MEKFIQPDLCTPLKKQFTSVVSRTVFMPQLVHVLFNLAGGVRHMMDRVAA